MSELLPKRLKQHPFLFYILEHKKKVFAGIFFVFLTNILDAALVPLLLKRGVDQIAGGSDLEQLATTCGLFALTIAGVALFRFIWRNFWGRYHHAVAEDLRRRIFAKYSTMGPSFYQSRPTGELMSLITNDINAFRMAAGPGVLVLFDALSISLIVLPVMYHFSPEWTWKTLILMPVVPLFIGKLEAAYRNLFRKQQDKFSEVSGIAQEVISGVRVIKSYSQEDNRTRIFNVKSDELREASNKVARVDSGFHPIMEFGVATGSMILLLIASDDVMTGAITIGTLVMFHRYIQKMIWPMTALGFGITLLIQGKTSFQRILEVLAADDDIPDTGTLEIDSFDSIQIKNLTFNYPGEEQPALKNINLEIKRGERIGIMGPVGSGKSTLAQVLCRLYPVASESVFYDDNPVENIKKNSLRQLISFVPQESFLFSQSVAENISLGLDSTAAVEDIRNVTKATAVDKEIREMPDSYDSMLGERGVNLSGGQKQRISMARALIRNSQLLIFDDSLSAVDAETEEKITAHLESFIEARDEHQRRKQTTLIISHRLRTLKKSDRIIVLNDGQIEASGSHAELLQSSPTYQRMCELQGEVSREIPGAAR